jgi:hypothetical protein
VAGHSRTPNGLERAPKYHPLKLPLETDFS